MCVRVCVCVRACVCACALVPPWKCEISKTPSGPFQMTVDAPDHTFEL